MAFEESKHPRAKDGKFTSKGNEGAGSGSTKEEKKIYSYNDLEKDLESKGIKGHTSTLYNEAKRGLGNLKRVKEISGGWWKNINPEEIYELVQKVNDDEEELSPYEKKYGKLSNLTLKYIENGDISDPRKTYKEETTNNKQSQDKTKEDDEKERKQAYKLFNLPF